MLIWGSMLLGLPAWAAPLVSTPDPKATVNSAGSARLLAPPLVSADQPASQPPLVDGSANLPSRSGSSLRFDPTLIAPLQPAAQLQLTQPFVSFEPQSTPVVAQTVDPELGTLRLQDDPNSPANCNPDPELGCVRLQEPLPLPPAPAARAPVVYLLGRLNFFRSSNIFSAVDPVNDGLINPGLTLYAIPALGPNTFLVASVDGNLVRYSTQTQINYDEIRLRTGILQRLSPNMFGEIGWSNQQLFISGDELKNVGFPAGTRFLNEHAIRLELSRRDQIAPRLALSSFYQFRYSFADPDSRSRVINAFIGSLSYDIQPTLQAAIDYQFNLANFTRQDREDQYHQVIGRLTYTAFRSTQLNAFVGYSFGRSSDPTVDFTGLILGIGMSFSVGF